MNKISPFQIIIMAFLGIMAILAVLIFGGFLPGYKDRGGGTAKAEKISLWGPFPQEKINPAILSLNKENRNTFTISYTEVPASSYEEEVINALASGKGPDIWIISQDAILKNKNKIFPIPFTYYPQRNFLDNFIGAGELFLDEEAGVIGIPFLVDPIVLYWNKDLFADVGISQAPRHWDEFLDDVKEMTVKNEETGAVSQSGAALGEFTNISNAKEILSALIMQAGNPIVITSSAGSLKVVLDEKNSSGGRPAENSLSFFNQFSNPNKEAYSWNKALPKSDTLFARGTLAMYFGYASDIEKIRSENPHLNFDIAEIPQLKNAGSKTTFGKVYAVAILKNSVKNQARLSAILNAVVGLTSQTAGKNFSESSGLSSARRGMDKEIFSDAYFSLINKASLVSRAWLDPDSKKTELIFKEMAESVASGSTPASTAVNLAKKKIEQLIKQ